MTEPTPQKVPFDADLVKYLMIDMASVCVAMYFILCEIQPQTLTEWGLPILLQGNMNYVIACLVVMTGAVPLMKYVHRKAAIARENLPPSNEN